MIEYDDFRQLFAHIRQIKVFVIQLKGEKLHRFCVAFYSLPFPEWRLDLLWEYIWGDKEYEEIYYIFKNSKLI